MSAEELLTKILQSASLSETAYWVLAGLALGIAMIRGRRPERLFALGDMLTLYALAVIIEKPRHLVGDYSGLAVVDAGLFVYTLPIALLSKRYWPMVATGALTVKLLIDVAAIMIGFKFQVWCAYNVVCMAAMHAAMIYGTLLEARSAPSDSSGPRTPTSHASRLA